MVHSYPSFFTFRCIQINTPIQIITDTKEPAVVANPIGNNVKTVDSIEDGTRNKKLIIFSTIPTAAASFSPR